MPTKFSDDSPDRGWPGQHWAWSRADKLARYHTLGISELVSFDPSNGRVRVWDRIDGDLVERVDMYFVVAPLAGAPCVRLARDASGRVLLPTPEERLAEPKHRKKENFTRPTVLYRLDPVRAAEPCLPCGVCNPHD